MCQKELTQESPQRVHTCTKPEKNAELRRNREFTCL